MAIIFYTYDCQFCEHRQKVKESELSAIVNFKCGYYDGFFQLGGYPENVSDFHCDIYRELP